MQSTEYSDQRPSRPSEISEVSSHSIHVLHFSPASNLCQGFNLPAPFSLWLIQVDESPDRQARRGSEVTRTLAQTLQIQRKWVSSRAATLIDLQFWYCMSQGLSQSEMNNCVWNLRCKKWSDLHWSVMKCICSMNLPTLAFCPRYWCYQSLPNLFRCSLLKAEWNYGHHSSNVSQNKNTDTFKHVSTYLKKRTAASSFSFSFSLFLFFLFCCFVTCFVSVVLSFSPVSTTYSQKSGT